MQTMYCMDFFVFVSEGTKAYVELEKVILDPRLLKAVSQLSTRKQTYALEAYHSLLLQFAPKSVAFSYKGMLCRSVNRRSYN